MVAREFWVLVVQVRVLALRYEESLKFRPGALAQSIRASACQAEGCGFESRRHRKTPLEGEQIIQGSVGHRLIGRAVDFGSTRASSSLTGPV